MKCKYEKVNCPCCSTEMHISKVHRNDIVKCLCGKQFMVTAVNGKYKLCELEEVQTISK